MHGMTRRAFALVQKHRCHSSVVILLASLAGCAGPEAIDGVVALDAGPMLLPCATDDSARVDLSTQLPSAQPLGDGTIRWASVTPPNLVRGSATFRFEVESPAPIDAFAIRAELVDRDHDAFVPAVNIVDVVGEPGSRTAEIDIDLYLEGWWALDVARLLADGRPEPDSGGRFVFCVGR